jgi:hypothetical protein
MFTLSQASYDTKEILKWGGIFIAGLVVVVVFIQMFLMVKEIIFPTPPPKPTVAFGKLDPQLFPANVSDKKFTYKINTLSGYLPVYNDLGKVYKIKTFTPDLLSLQNATAKVAVAGFTANPTQLSNTSYQWNTTARSGLLQSIKVNIVDDNFTLTSDFLSNQAALSGALSKETDVIKAANFYFNQINPLPTDIDNTKTQTTLFAAENGLLTPATSFANAQAIRVDFFQKDVNGLPIVYGQPHASDINILVGPNDQIFQAQYFYQTPTKESATYPLITSTQAYQELQSGNAYIASYDGTSTTVSITDVTLAYYMSSQNQSYLMPIFVFQGSNNFTAYVPAVTDVWINK